MPSYKKHKMFFGERQSLLKQKGKVVLEFLTFNKEGRDHSHQQYESCYVISGTGKIISGKKVHTVKAGSFVTIPPKTLHWMIPAKHNPLQIIILYHDKQLG